MQQPIIRRAGPEDATRLAAIGARTFEETFGHLYRPQDLADFLASNHSLPAAQAALGDAGQAVWLATAGDAVVGYAHAGPCALPHPDVTDSCRELKRLYLLRPWQGGGLGARLCETALAWMEAGSPPAVFVGVWSENHGAQRFYARYGFSKVGEYDFAVGASCDREFIFKLHHTHGNST